MKQPLQPHQNRTFWLALLIFLCNVSPVSILSAQDKITAPNQNETAAPEEEHSTLLPANLKLRKSFLEAMAIEDPATAVAAFTKILVEFPNTAPAYYQLARLAKTQTQDIFLIQDYIQKAIAIDPNNVHYRIYFAEQIANSKPQLALHQYLQFIRLQPRSLSIYLTTYQLLETQLRNTPMPLNEQNHYLADSLTYLANFYTKQFGENANSYRMYYFANIANNNQAKADSILVRYQQLYGPTQAAENTHSQKETVDTEAETPASPEDPKALNYLLPNDDLQGIFSPYLFSLENFLITDTANKFLLAKSTKEDPGFAKYAKIALTQLEEDFPFFNWDTLKIVNEAILNNDLSKAQMLIQQQGKSIRNFTVGNFYNHLIVLIAYQQKDFNRVVNVLQLNIEKSQSVHPSIIPIALNTYKNHTPNSDKQKEKIAAYKKLASELTTPSK